MHGKEGVSGSILPSFYSTLMCGWNAEGATKGDSRVGTDGEKGLGGVTGSYKV